MANKRSSDAHDSWPSTDRGAVALLHGRRSTVDERHRPATQPRAEGRSGADRQSALPPPLAPDQAAAADDAHAAPDETPGAMRAIEILSHELRSPITTIHLGTKVLRESGRRISRPVRLEVVQAVEEEAERLYRLVEDLLAVARHDGGGMPLPVRPLALQHWLPDVLAAEVQVSPTLAVRASIPPDVPPVLADDAALAHVMRNLLGNAVRYAADGMPVEVVTWAPDARTVRIEVLDRGPGTDPGDAERLFEPFYRTASAEALGSGAGLGLAAARRLLGAMQGTIEALPRDGGGSRFVLTLPVAAADVEDDVADPPPRAGTGSG